MREAEKKKDNALTLSYGELTLIQPGWYWYEDGSFSSVLISGKKLKAVVAFVQNSTIYGDVLMEKECPIDVVKAFLKECQQKVSDDVCLPSLREHEFLSDNIKLINEALSHVSEAPLWRGYYLTGTDYSFNQFWIKMYPEGTHSASRKGGIYKVRPLIYCSID